MSIPISQFIPPPTSHHLPPLRRHHFQQLRDTWFWATTMLELCCLMHTTKSKYLLKPLAAMRQRRICLGGGGKIRTASQWQGTDSWGSAGREALLAQACFSKGTARGQLPAAEEATSWVWGHWRLERVSSQAETLRLLQKLSPAPQREVPYVLTRKSSHLFISL